jgi:hypothetical protein
MKNTLSQTPIINALYYEAVEKNMNYASIIGNAIGALRIISSSTNDKVTKEYAQSQIKYLENKFNLAQSQKL